MVDSRLREELFEAALELPPDERPGFLATRCGDDDELRRDLLSLLDAHQAAGSFLDPAELGADAASDPLGDLTGKRLGAFTVGRLIEVGGMGAVYEATQDEPRRPVALKVLRASLEIGERRHRFRREIDLLGRVEHPGIARVYAGGVERLHGVEVPYMALELVDGARPLTDVTTTRPLARNLEWILEVCDAVHHAHLRGIVHRDLKPANVLVDSANRVRVIDFGVAGLLDEEPDDPRVTRDGQIFGTLAYMSPEQFDGGAPPDVRSDVYSLGLILFEILAGEPAFDVAGLSITAALRERASDPPSLAALRGDLARDLVAIVECATRRDPTQRYGSMAEFASDLRRFLRHEPTFARPPSRMRAVALFVRRHALLTGATAVVITTLAISTAFSLFQLEKTRRANASRIEQLELATAESAVRKQTLDFMLNVFAAEVPQRAKGDDSRLSERLEFVAAGIDELEVEPRVRSLLFFHYGRLAHLVAQTDLAASMLGRAHELGEQAELEPDLKSEILQTMGQIAAASDVGRAIELFRRALAILPAGDRAMQVRRRSVELDLAQSLVRTGALEEARPLLEALRPVLMSDPDTNPASIATCLDGLAKLAAAAKDFDEACALYDRAIEIMQVRGETPRLARLFGGRGLTRKLGGDLDAALADYTRALEIHTAVLPDTHEIGVLQQNIARVHVAKRHRAEALLWQDRAIATLRKRLGDRNFSTVNLMFLVVGDRIELGAHAEAESLAVTTLPLQRNIMGDRHSSVAVTLERLALCLERRGETEDAARHRREAQAIRDAAR